MAIKIKYQDPKSSDFGPNDIVINVVDGTIFYKSSDSIFKIKGDDLNTQNDTFDFDGSLSAIKGFFAGSRGIGNLKVEGHGDFRFKVGPFPTIEAGGHIIPKPNAAPLYDLGSAENPWRDVFLSPNSLRFIQTSRGLGSSRIGTTFKIGKYELETVGEEETLTLDNVTQLKSGRTITTASFDLGDGDISSTIIRPDAIINPTDETTYTKYTTRGRVGQFVDGILFFDQNRNGDNNYIALGTTDTQIRITGTITASIDGGSF